MPITDSHTWSATLQLPWYRCSVYLLIMLCLSGCNGPESWLHRAEPTPQPVQPTPCVGELLRQKQEKLYGEILQLTAAAEEMDREVEQRRAELTSLQQSSARSYRLSWISNLSETWYIAWALIWLLLLIVGYRKIERNQWRRWRRYIRLCYLVLAILGIATIATSFAAEDDSAGSTQPIQPDLAGVMDTIHRYEAADSWKRTKSALEDRGCYEVAIPDDVITWLQTNCPLIDVPNPVKGYGVERVMVLVAFEWAAGDRVRALKSLGPLLRVNYDSDDERLRYYYRQALVLLAKSGEQEVAERTAAAIARSATVTELLDLMEILQSCCREKAEELLTLAKERVRTTEELMALADKLRGDFRVEEAAKLLDDQRRILVAHEDLGATLTYIRSFGLEALAGELLDQVIESQRRTSELLTVAATFQALNETQSVHKALTRAIEVARSAEELTSISQTAIGWELYDLAMAALKKFIELSGSDGIMVQIEDPKVLGTSQDPISDEQPSVGIVLATIAQKLSDYDTARSYYSAVLSRDLGAAYSCQGKLEYLNLTNFLYAYNFLRVHGDSLLLPDLDAIGRRLEEFKMAQLTDDRTIAIRESITQKELEISEIQDEIRSARRSLLVGKLRWSAGFLFKLLSILCFLIAQYIIVRRALRHGSVFNHLKVSATAAKLIELEGFFVLFSVLLAPVGILLIVIMQFIQALLYSEQHLFRLVEQQRSGAWLPYSRLPIIPGENEQTGTQPS